MSEDLTTTAAPAIAPGKSFSLRALIAGFILVIGVALVTPANDWLLRNTYFYSQHLPVGVSLLVVLLGVVINPLLGRWRFRSGELMVIVGMLLVLGGVASSGLNRVFPAIISGPAKIIPTSTELAAYVDENGTVRLPQGPYIGFTEDGKVPDTNDPEYRYVIEGHHQGLGVGTPSVVHRATVTWSDATGTHTALALEGQSGEGILDLDSPLGRALRGQKIDSVSGAGPTTITGPEGEITLLAIEPPPIPWSVWGKALLAWTPLLLSAMICFLCMAALVRHQWIHNERLTYPIANVLVGFLRDPEPGRKLAPIFRTSVFWVAFGVVAFVLVGKALQQYGILPFSVPTVIDLNASFGTPPFNQGFAAWAYLRWIFYFSIIGLTFFLPADISFSVWFCFIFGNLIYAVMNSNGVPVDNSMPSKVSMGGWFVQCLLILWVGRVYYLRLLKAAILPSDDPSIAVLRPFTWAFLASALGLVLAMTALGAEFGSAVVAALCYLGTGLVMARLIAEAGIPFMQTPMSWNVSNLIYSLVGFNAPMAALVPLTMLAQTLVADPREHLLPFATNAEYLGERAGVPRLRWTTVSLVVLAIGTVVAGASMLWCAYDHDGHQNLDGWWRGGPLMGSLGPIATHASGTDPIDPQTTFTCYGVGAVTTAGLGIARLAWSWWPVHPIGMLVFACYPIYQIWFSIFLGWMAKVLVMRYGGMQLYQKLKPAAMGLIAAEAVIAGIFLVIGIITKSMGSDLPVIKFLPG